MLFRSKQHLNVLYDELVKRMKDARNVLSAEKCQVFVLEMVYEDLGDQLERYVAAHRQNLMKALENLSQKYGVTLLDVQSQQENAALELAKILKELHYA